MNKIAFASAVLMMTVGMTRASVITIDVTDGGGTWKDSYSYAGVVASPYIEAVQSLGSTSLQSGIASTDINNFTDSTGAGSGVGISSSGWKEGSYSPNDIEGFNPDQDYYNNTGPMMQNYALTQSSASVTFTGLNTWLSGQGANAYNVYVMSDIDIWYDYEGEFSIGATSYWLCNGGLQKTGGSYDARIQGPFVQGTATTQADALAAKNTANYVMFSGVTGDSFTLNISGSDTVVNGIQIQAVPEPMTLSMVGILGTVAMLIRRRNLG